MTSKGNPKLTVRMPEELRARLVAEAHNAGTSASELVVEFSRWWLGEPGAELPKRPQSDQAPELDG